MATRLQTDDRNDLTGEHFAFPHQRKEPLDDASHVRNAIARFDQVEGVTDAERDAAWKRILSAAKQHGVTVHRRAGASCRSRSAEVRCAQARAVEPRRNGRGALQRAPTRAARQPVAQPGDALSAASCSGVPTFSQTPS